MCENELLEEISTLKKKLREKEDELARLRRRNQILQENGLNNQEITRYSRQIILPEIGVQGRNNVLGNLVIY